MTQMLLMHISFIGVHFLDPLEELGTALTKEYNPYLVALSLTVSSLAAYTAITVSFIIQGQKSRLAHYFWLCVGAVLMGSGIWVMHFLGMLSLKLAIDVNYDLVVTFISVLPAVLASGISLYLACLHQQKKRYVIYGGISMGVGIAAMHYIGMKGMIMNGVMRYDPTLMIISLVVAVIFATISMYVLLNYRKNKVWAKVIAAFIMGLAVFGMHFISMLGVIFYEFDKGLLVNSQNSIFLIVGISVVAIASFSLSIIATLVEHLLTKARQYNSTLELNVAERTAQLNAEVSERAKTQDKLEKNEQHLRSILSAVPEGIITLTSDGRVIGFNNAAEKIFGYSVINAMDKGFETLIEDEFDQDKNAPDREAIQDRLLEMLGAQRESRGRKKSGEYFPVEMALSLVEQEDDYILIAVTHDISARKAVEKKLKDQEKIVREALDNLPGGIMFVNSDLKILVSNDHFGKLQKIPKELTRAGEDYGKVVEFIGRKGGGLGDGDQEEAIRKRIAHLAKPIAEIFEHVTPDNKILEVRRSPSPSGGFVIVTTDTTQRKQAEIKLQQTLDALNDAQEVLIESEKMAALGGLVAGISHEVNTPIGIAVTAASHLQDNTLQLETSFKEGTATKANLNSFLQTSLQSSKILLTNLERAAELIRSFKRVAVDISTDDFMEINIASYLQEILSSLKPELRKISTNVTVDCPEDITFTTNPGSLSQIVTNLVMNSLIHGFEGRKEGDINLAIEEKEDQIEFSYMDNGHGMKQSTVDKIFDPFFTTKRGAGGSGLGMHILYNLITQSLKGSIICNSTPGEGTEFIISFPREVLAES